MGAPLLTQAYGLAGALPPLLIAAERVAQQVYYGVHGRRRAGTGETFWQFRRYEQGDAADRIDWRQSARTDKVFVREREWEAAQTACLWADSSGSMRYRSHKNLPEKIERARLLMLALAHLCLRGGEQVLWLGPQPMAVRRKDVLERIALQQASELPPYADQTLPAFAMPRHAHVILCSDFLMPIEMLEQQMRRYAEQKTKGVFVHILDPLEESFALQGRVDLRGCEDEAAVLLPDAKAVQSAYAHRLAAHKARLGHIARSAGWSYLSHTTDGHASLPLSQLYQMLVG